MDANDVERLLSCVENLPIADRYAPYMHAIRCNGPLDSDNVAYVIPKAIPIDVKTVNDTVNQREGALFPVYFSWESI